MLAGLVVVLAVGTAAYVLYPRPIPIMTGDLNVAVAEFGALDAPGGSARPTQNAGRFALRDPGDELQRSTRPRVD